MSPLIFVLRFVSEAPRATALMLPPTPLVCSNLGSIVFTLFD